LLAECTTTSEDLNSSEGFTEFSNRLTEKQKVHKSNISKKAEASRELVKIARKQNQAWIIPQKERKAEVESLVKVLEKIVGQAPETETGKFEARTGALKEKLDLILQKLIAE
jgi:hypothetical protein